jgi:hypothetical protein
MIDGTDPANPRLQEQTLKAWWAYWLTLAIGAALWIGVAVVGGREGIRTAVGHPIWAAILLAPIFVAGFNLVAFRRTHEVVCRLEAERHRWLSVLVGRGYSARTFALTGLMLLALGVVLVWWVANGAP